MKAVKTNYPQFSVQAGSAEKEQFENNKSIKDYVQYTWQSTMQVLKVHS